MHLKSLTMKGFKSFASSTTLKLEPGICAVVGPNGSGKSNVVDALAWVMGEHSAKTLRGGKMEDVIFAGAGERKPLGRAEVTLTIDNSDGALPIDYTEVSVTRRMFRDGASEYEINGARARLMDVQELLSDTGIGREMHVIVGQGRLAQILESKPEERRAFIEEAAGVLKHRRRKEKAQRKLVSMQANVDRLQDLTEELHRQLGPLSRQADAAQRATTVQATIRAARESIAAHTARQLSEALEAVSARCQASERAVDELRAEVETAAETQRAAEEELRTALEAAEAARSLWFRLSAVAEKNSATLRIARDRAVARPEEAYTGPDPAELLRRAEEAEEQQAQLEDAVARAAERLRERTAEAERCEATARAAEREHLAQVRAVADRREGVVRLLAQHEAAQQRVHAVRQESERLAESTRAAEEALASATAEAADAAEEVSRVEALGQGQGERLERAQRESDQAEARADQLRRAQRDLEREIAGVRASIASWEDRARPVDAAADLQQAARAAGLEAEPLAELLRVRPGSSAAGWGQALSAALGPVLSQALVVRSENPGGLPGDVAAGLLSQLAAADRGRAAFLEPSDRPSWRLDSRPVAGRWLLDLVEAPDDVARALAALLVDVVAVDDLQEARRVVDADRRLRAVTREGVLVGDGWAAAGSGGTTAVDIAERLAQARADVASKAEQLEDMEAGLDAALATAAERRALAAAARAEAAQHRSTLTSARNRAAAAAKSADAARRQAQRASASREDSAQRIEAAERHLAELADRVSRINTTEREDEPSTAARDAAASALAQSRSQETEARLELRTAEERAGAARGRAEALRRQARSEHSAREARQRAIARREAARRRAEAVHTQAQRVAERLTEALARAENARTLTTQRHRDGQARLAEVRERASAAAAQLDAAVTAAHSAEMERGQLQVKLDSHLASTMEQLGLGLEPLLALELPEDFAPAEAKAELKRAEKALSALGKVNPLALEEYTALQERYQFLATQLEDVERARADLRDVIEDVDATIQELFAQAWRDVEAEFPRVFSTLFPGGSGRLLLTDPDDMLTTGIEVEARPPGKKVKRLSLLSGGEKSLTALAMLVAIFRARPSPFYVMDEVEAALDDVNLRRLIALFEELRKDSQLIVITHQKPTMDVANVLYGVTMRGDGVTRVISQRMNPGA